MAQKFAWGIDIGESAIKAVKVRRAGESVVVQEYRTIQCEAPPGKAQSADREFRVRNALAELQFEAKLKGCPVAVSVPGRDVFPRFIPLPPVDKKRIPEIVRYEARNQMPFPIEEVIWDYQPISGLDVPGEEVEVAFFAIKKATIYGYLTNLRLAGISPDIMEISPLATYNFFVHDQAVETGSVIIDVGAGNTDLVIVDGDRFWIRSVAISGNDITRALQEKYQISFEEAESLKRKAASSQQSEKLFGSMRPIVDDLIGEIQRSIGYYKAQTRNVRIEKVILLGNAFKLPKLVDYFRTSLDYEVSLLEGLNRVRVSGSADSAKFESELSSYAVALGLAIQAVGLGKVNIDLLPREVMRERILRQKIPYAAAALVLLAAPLGLGYQSASSEIGRCQYEIGPIEEEIAKYQKQLDDEGRAAGMGRVGDDLKLLSSFGRGRSEWLLFLDRINLAVNELKREPFRLNSIREVTAAEAAGLDTRADSLGRVGAPRADQIQGLGQKIEIKLEKDTRFSAKDIDDLRSLLQAQHPLVTDVEGRGESQGPTAQRTGAGAAAAGSGWIYTFWVTFATEKAAPVVAAPHPPTKGRPVPIPKQGEKRSENLRKID